jgi:hypothetical protein
MLPVVQHALDPGRWGLRLLVGATGVGGLAVQLLGTSVYLSYVYWDWIGAGLNPPDAYLFVPEISPLVAHWDRLGDPRYLHYWIVWVAREYGLHRAALLAAPPLLVGLLAGRYLWAVWRAATSTALGSESDQRSDAHHQAEHGDRKTQLLGSSAPEPQRELVVPGGKTQAN